ncbi:MAG: hypothetical protein A2Y38_23315 [Spirochaetes bacterium GWB1_59_5]|nr:MAG: hypothetical protein A2Y38_23315 [Spirochaetes bacterium GWB1_59_5]
MQLDTENTIYVCTDRDNAEVKLLLPKRLTAWMKENKMDLSELNLSDPSPESTDAAEYKLLAEEMEEHRFDV